MSTIVALSSPTGGAIAMVRLSGEGSLEVLRTIFDRHTEPRHATFGRIVNPSTGVTVDEVVCTYFAAPYSYTGEDMVEISCHGSAWIAGEIMRLLVDGGATMAAAGEFSKRAFLNGKIDLSQAEAVADLIASQSAAAARVAMNQMRGGYKIELSTLRAKLLHIKSMLELEMDFGQEDVQFASRDELAELLEEVIAKISTLASSFESGNAIKNGVVVAIIGEPNAGKSTLLNALVGDDRAIVSPEAGTTRDYIESLVTLDGVLFRFVDTAGLRDSSSEIESEGIRRSREQASRAHIVLHLIPSPDAEALPLDEFNEAVTVRSKCDEYACRSKEGLYISAKTGEGLSVLRRFLVERSGVDRLSSDEVLVSNARHAECLNLALTSLTLSLDELRASSPSDKICSSMSDGLSHLAEITGEFTTNEILANIFSTFCIGK